MALSLSPLQRVYELGQSIWYDNIRRGLITSGELQRLIDQDAVVGVTSNPSIFEKAIDGSSDYDDAIRALVGSGVTDPAQIYEQLTVEDVLAAADILRPIYERTRGQDGYVSIEVSPAAANDTRMTIAEARRLWQRVKRPNVATPNVMIKVPATAAGLPAIEQLIYEGVNVNVTLIFSLDRYEEVTEAYIRGLEYRLQENAPLAGIASVASFFVSRFDTLVDSLLQQRLQNIFDPQQRATLQQTLGTAAIANAKLAYQLYRKTFASPRFAALQAAGAVTQRCLWASTSTKNPAYSDVKYVEALIGAETVDTLPPQTIVAFQDHGHARATLGEDVPGAEEAMRRLIAIGIDMRAVTHQLEVEGVQSFADSYAKVIETTRQKIERLRAAATPVAAPISGGAVSSGGPAVNLTTRQSASLGTLQPLADTALQRAERERFVDRLWRKDPTLWAANPAEQQGIVDRLGWLSLTEQMAQMAPQLDALRADVRASGFTHCVLLGADGDSLASEAIRQAFGLTPGQPDLIALDTSDPAAILAVQQAIVPSQTLFLIASRSGSIETISQFRYFYDMIRQRAGERAGAQFIAITDPGSRLDQIAQEYRFRAIFRNPPGIGGAFAALSYFGLVPAAVLGLDVRALLERAQTMAQACGPTVPTTRNPGLCLGAVLGALAANGQNKLTLAISPPVAGIGRWLEQLLATTISRDGTGILPVVGEALGLPSVYSADRLFVYIRSERGFDAAQDAAIAALEMAGYPVVRLAVGDAYDLGQEFVLWELTTAFAGAYLGTNPFEPPVADAASAITDRLLQEYTRTHLVPLPKAILQTETRNVSIVADGEQALRIRGAISLQQAIESVLRQVVPGDYVALLACVLQNGEAEGLLQRLRLRVRDARRVATTLDFGSRCQDAWSHCRGGPGNGLFIQFVATGAVDVPIPGAPYTFGVLGQAQALAGLQALAAHHSRVIRIDLGANMIAGLAELEQALDAAQL